MLTKQGRLKIVRGLKCDFSYLAPPPPFSDKFSRYIEINITSIEIIYVIKYVENMPVSGGKEQYRIYSLKAIL